MYSPQTVIITPSPFGASLQRPPCAALRFMFGTWSTSSWHTMWAACNQGRAVYRESQVAYYSRARTALPLHHSMIGQQLTRPTCMPLAIPPTLHLIRLPHCSGATAGPGGLILITLIFEGKLPQIAALHCLSHIIGS